MRIKKHLCALLSLIVMLGTVAVVPITASAGIVEDNAATINSLHVGDYIDKGTLLNFQGEYARIAYYLSAADETPYYEEMEEWNTIRVGGKHDYYIIRSISADAGEEWKAAILGAYLNLELVGCYDYMYIIGDGRNNWLDGKSWEKVELYDRDPGPCMFGRSWWVLKPGDYEFYFETPDGDRLGGTFPGFNQMGSIQSNAPSIKFTVDDYCSIDIYLENSQFKVSKYNATYIPPTASYEQVGKDYPADAVNVHGASLWKVNVNTGTFAANELNVKVNGKTAGEPIVSTQGFTGSVVFGVVLNGVKDDIQSFDVLVDGESASIE